MTGCPHLLGIDEGPFDKRADRTVGLVGVMMEGPRLVEAVATSTFPVDGEDPSQHLASWIAGLRFGPALHGVLLGGVTLAGLGMIDLPELARLTSLPAMIVNRREPENEALEQALRAAGLEQRIEILRRSPAAWRHDSGVWIAHAGIDRDRAARWIGSCQGKSRVPEPLRVAHLIAGAIATGQSRGRP